MSREGLLEKFQNATEEEFDARRIDQRVYYSTLDTLKSRADGGQAKAEQNVSRNQREAQAGREPSGPQYSVKQDPANSSGHKGYSMVVATYRIESPFQ